MRGLGTAVRCLLAAAALAGQACRTTQPPQGTPREVAARKLAQGDAAGALALLEPLARASPEDLSLRRAVAEAHTRAGTADALLLALQGRTDAPSLYQKGLLLFARSAADVPRAVEAFRGAVQARPEEAELHHRLGVALLESEQEEQALPVLEEAVRLRPAAAAWWLPLAKARARLGNGPGAVEALAVAVKGALSAAEVGQAVALMEQLADPFARLPQEARPRLEKALRFLEVVDVPQQALYELEEVNQSYPDLPVVHTLMGLACARLDDVGRAVEEFKRAIELDPRDGKNHLYLAELYQGRQRAVPAREHYEKAVVLHPTLQKAWLRLGELALEKQDLPTARAHLTVAARLGDQDPAARGKLALVYQLEGDWPQAERELQALLETEPESVEYQLRLGVLHTERFLKARTRTEREEASAEAQKWLAKVLEAQPENALASRALERVRTGR